MEVARAADRIKTVDLDEYQRASWLWRRRPSDTSILVHLLIFGVGALIHIPLILVENFVVFAVYHTLYVGVGNRLRGSVFSGRNRDIVVGSRITFVRWPGWQTKTNLATDGTPPLTCGIRVICGFKFEVRTGLQAYTRKWISSGKMVEILLTMFPRSKLRSALRCGAPTMRCDAPTVAAMSTMVSAGESLTA